MNYIVTRVPTFNARDYFLSSYFCFHECARQSLRHISEGMSFSRGKKSDARIGTEMSINRNAFSHANPHPNDAPLDRARNKRVPRENPFFARVTHRVPAVKVMLASERHTPEN